MYFSINSDVFAKHIAVISKAQSSKNALPILDSILIESANGKINLIASDAENYLCCELDSLEHEGEMKIAIDSKKLYNSVKEIGDQPITIETHNGMEISITYLNGKYNLMSGSASEYPQNNFRAVDSTAFSIDSDTLKNGLGHCSWAVANDELRPQMNGVYFDTSGDTLVMVATDGHKLVKDSFKVEGFTSQDSGFILLPKTIGILQNMVGKDTQTVDIIVAQDKSKATFRIGEYCLSCLLIDKKYMNYNSVIPQDLPFVAVVDKSSLRALCSRVLVCASSISNLLKFRFEEGTLTVSSKDIDFSTSAEEKMNIDYNASPISIGFKGEFIKQILKELPGESVRILMHDPSKAAILVPEEKSESGEDILMLLMPMQLLD